MAGLRGEHAMNLTKPILVTGASGKTGRRVVAAIAKRGGKVRAFVRREQAGSELTQSGAAEVAIGDLTDAASLRHALAGAGQVLHICPPMHPQEDTIAATLIDLATEQAVERFVLYSVLHPLLDDVPHHARKLNAERYLVNSGLTCTILQPSRYMQHLASIWKTVLATGVHAMPFSTARILTEMLGWPIRAATKPPDEFRRDATAAGMPAERIETMSLMNAHYDAHGLIGNPNVLRWLLGREPTRFAEFVRREMPMP
jgi:uncharacterized protein YbjT (DUF2867 family)